MSASKHPSCLSYALIGCGRVSIKHIKAVLKKDSGLALLAIVDSNPQAPAALLKSAGLSDKKIQSILDKVRIYRDYQEMLDSEKPQVVAITVPSGLHYQIAKASLLAGAHILLEKPMSMKSSEAKELYELSKKLDKKIAMGHIYRYFPLVSNLQKAIADGAFGQLSHGSVVVRWGHDQTYYDQAPWRGTWKSDGGALMNQTVHALDLLCWLMNGTATEATAMLAQRNHQMEAEDLALGILRLDSGALCQIEGTTNTLPSDHEAAFYICGTAGTLRVGLRRGRPYFDIRDQSGKKKNGYYYRKELREKGLKALLALTNPHVGIYKDLVLSIQTSKEPIADAVSGYTSIEMVLALYQSAKEKRTVTLPLESDFASTNMEGYFG